MNTLKVRLSVLLVALCAAVTSAQDRVTISVTSRTAVDGTLTVVTASGTALTIAAADLVYVRDDWPHWIDEDGDCQDTRQEVLIAESITPVTMDPTGCRVLAGAWRDLYTGSTITEPSELDVDHLVPLANAFRSGGWAWDRTWRQLYANDLIDATHLIAVSASANRQKGDKGPDQWRPEATTAWCAYSAAWTRVKQRWRLTATEAENAALAELQTGCPDAAPPAPTPAPTPSVPAPSPEPTPAPPSTSACVNINMASSPDLQRIVHIGPDRAAAIIRLRPFASVDDLDRVSGIGPSRLADIKAQGLACV